MKYTIIMKNIGIGAFVLSTGLFSALSHAALLSSYDAGVDLTISSTFDDNAIDTEFYDSLEDATGMAIANASGSDTAGPDVLLPGEGGTISARANGAVDGGAGFAESFWAVDGYFTIENTTDTDITGDVSFDISWFASIFTDSPLEEAYAYVGIFIEDSFFNVVYEDYIETDSFSEGAGAFDADVSAPASFTLSNVVIAAGDFEEYYIEIDAYGFAEAAAPVPEPSSLFLAGLALLLVIRKHKQG